MFNVIFYVYGHSTINAQVDQPEEKVFDSSVVKANYKIINTIAIFN